MQQQQSWSVSSPLFKIEAGTMSASLHGIGIKACGEEAEEAERGQQLTTHIATHVAFQEAQTGYAEFKGAWNFLQPVFTFW